VRLIYFDCFAGVSGDMILGALVDAGLDPGVLRRELAKLDLPGYELRVTRAVKNGIQGTRVRVKVNHHDGPHTRSSQRHHHGRHLKEISHLIRTSRLSTWVKDHSLLVFRRLAEAEARIHGISPGKVHFHEVGAVDSIVDIVGTCIGIEALGIDAVYASAVPLGQGFVNCQHGTLPVPAPATLELLRGKPVRQTEITSELVTPTGAAVLVSLSESFGPMPPVTIEAIGYGAGTRDLEIPNMLRVVVGQALQGPEEGEAPGPGASDTVTILETNIDDMNPELFPALISQLLEAGAVDAFTTPVLMKKGRHGVKVTVVSPVSAREKVVEALFSASTTFGVRMWEAQRRKLSRHRFQVTTRWGPVWVKVGYFRGKPVTAAPEYEDCQRLARENNIPVRRIYEEALRLAARWR